MMVQLIAMWLALVTLGIAFMVCHRWNFHEHNVMINYNRVCGYNLLHVVLCRYIMLVWWKNATVKPAYNGLVVACLNNAQHAWIAF